MNLLAPILKRALPGRPGTGSTLRSQPPALLWAVVCSILLLLLPQRLYGHGELLIRIAAATRDIEACSKPSAQLYLARGELYRQDLNWAAAQADYHRAAQLEPELNTVDFCRARLLADSGQLTAANALLDKVIERSPENGDGWITRARVLAKLKRRPAAIADYERGLELLTEAAPEYFVELAEQLKLEQQPAQALLALERGIQKLGPLLALQVPALDLEVEQKNYQPALTRLEVILEQAHRKEHWLARRGDILLAAGRALEARTAYEKALTTIKTLPRPVQEGPAMRALQARVTSVLAGMAHPSMASK